MLRRSLLVTLLTLSLPLFPEAAGTPATKATEAPPPPPALTTQPGGLITKASAASYALPWYTDCKEFGKILLLAMGTVVAYGIVHNLITAHLCLDYFSHPTLTDHGEFTRVCYPWVYKSKSPVLYAFLWGVLATWWVGLALGIILGAVARLGSKKPKLTWKSLRLPAMLLVGDLLASALLGGYITYSLAPEKKAFYAVSYMHLWSYLAGLLGGLVLAGYVYWLRHAHAKGQPASFLSSAPAGP